jgi:hypothetical protein
MSQTHNSNIYCNNINQCFKIESYNNLVERFSMTDAAVAGPGGLTIGPAIPPGGLTIGPAIPPGGGLTIGPAIPPGGGVTIGVVPGGLADPGPTIIDGSFPNLTYNIDGSLTYQLSNQQVLKQTYKSLVYITSGFDVMLVSNIFPSNILKKSNFIKIIKYLKDQIDEDNYSLSVSDKINLIKQYRDQLMTYINPVSYTHLTLPTSP